MSDDDSSTGDSPNHEITSPRINIEQPFENLLGQRKRKTAITGSKLSENTEIDDHKVLLHLKQPALHKRFSLTPESKHRERPALQSSHSLELGSLPTWRGKTFVTLHNYWTGEQQSDRLHHQAPQVTTQNYNICL